MKLLKTIADAASITRDAILGLTELPALHSLAQEATDKRVDELAKKRAVEYCNTDYDQDIANLTEERKEALALLSCLSSSLGSGLGGEDESLISMVTRVNDGLKMFVDHTNNFTGEQRASVEKLTTELKGAREFERARAETQERRIKDILGERDTARKERDELKRAINRDRTGLGLGLAAVRRIANGYAWIANGEWASYDYTQQNEVTLRSEVGFLIEAIENAALSALKASGDLVDAAINGKLEIAEPTEPLAMERDELKAQLATEQQLTEKLSDALRGAEDYLSNFEMENLERIGNVEFIYIRDALKCLRGTDCL
jgi:hypothetical protein